MRIAYAELGVHESPGGVFNPRIMRYMHGVGLHPTDDSAAPWCAALVNWVLMQAGMRGTGSAAARSFLGWGLPVIPVSAQLGDVVVLWRNQPNGPFGHVGFFVDQDSKTMSLLGGNQADAVSVATYPKKRLLAVRRPA